MTRTSMNNLVSAGDVGPEDEKQFYAGARAFFIDAFKYALSHMPLDDELLINAEMVYFEQRENIKPSMVQYFVERYITKIKVIDRKNL